MIIPTHLIENALALTGKTMEDMKIEIFKWLCFTEFWDFNWPDCEVRFSDEYFCFYLLSDSFINNYLAKVERDYMTHDCESELCMYIWYSIKEYQSWNHKPLQNLLEKIPTP